jgi:hypothetical protein
MHGIKVLMAKNYIDNLSEETKKGMLEKAEQGIWPSFAPIGYKNVQVENGRKIIVVDDHIAPLIKKIYELYATGNYSVIEVTRKVKELGLPFGNGKTHLPQSTIHKILRNRVYTGDFEWNGKIYKGTHEAMVDNKLWTHVQDLIENKLGNRQKKAKHNFAFAGFIRCSACGSSLVGDIKKQKYVYYRCSGCKKEHAKPYIKESIIEEKFAQILQTLQFDQEILQMIIHALKESNEDKHKYYKEAIQRLQAQFNKLDSRLQAIYVDKLDGNITNEFFEDKSREWRNEQSNVLRQIDHMPIYA